MCIRDSTNSNATVRLTRGLFTTYAGDKLSDYKDQKVFVENNGVTPDVEYEHSLEDVRAGYVGYVEELSKLALKQIK